MCCVWENGRQVDGGVLKILEEGGRDGSGAAGRSPGGRGGVGRGGDEESREGGGVENWSVW